MLTKEEFYEGLKAEATRYEAIGYVPDYPLREDVYYAHEKLPIPDKNHRYFEEFMDFFNFENDAYRTLGKAFIAAPMFYVRSIPRPSWIIDSNDGPGTGKTTIAETVSYLYGSAPVQVTPKELRHDMLEVVKRLVSSEGRNARVFLLDNVVGNFRSEELSSLITRADITGKPPYGRGEESRPNNLTYVITSNNAFVDNDIAIRSFFLFIKQAQLSPTWKRSLMDYIEENRYRIFADIVDILTNNTPFEGLIPCTRFPEFETEILQAFCADVGEFDKVIETIGKDKQDGNSDEEMARQVEDLFRTEMVELGIHPDNQCVFIRSAIAEHWLKKALPNEQRLSVGILRTFSQAGLLPIIDRKLTTWPSNGKNRRKGIMWNKQKEGSKIVVNATVDLSRHGKPLLIAGDLFSDEI